MCMCEGVILALFGYPGAPSVVDKMQVSCLLGTLLLLILLVQLRYQCLVPDPWLVWWMSSSMS